MEAYSQLEIGVAGSFVQRMLIQSTNLWGRHQVLIILFCIAVFLDAVSTIYFMVNYGPEGHLCETHPIIRYISGIIGPYQGPMFCFVWKVWGGIVVAIYLNKWAPYFLVTAIIISTWAAWYNIWGIDIYHANIFNFIPW